MLNQKLQQKLQQKLSPQQIQVIKLLEIPTMMLDQRIKKEIEENPALESENNGDEYEIPQENNESSDDSDEFSIDDYFNEDEYSSYKFSANNNSPDPENKEIPFSAGSTFQEHLQDQLGLQSLDEEQKLLAEYIIGNIDEDGYLRREIDNIVDDVAFAQNIYTNEAELLHILEVVQRFDPPGIGARDLQECLVLQIKRKDTSIKSIRLAASILKNFFNEFTKKHYEKIITKLDITEDDFRDALQEILKLNPKPGSSFSDPHNKTAQQVIIPDFILEEEDGELELSLNSRNVPELKVSKTYAEMLLAYKDNKNKSREQKDAVTFVKQKLDSAKWFIDAIRQRQHTLLSTMQTIVEYQKEYFKTGDETNLRPMILKDIADRTGLDVSTISRVANSKYIQTNFGIFSLKYFFSEGMQTESGEEVSSREIKKILEECIEGEDKRKPLTDEKLAQILKSKGYQIARRTVAKYREQLNIPVGRLRKEI